MACYSIYTKDITDYICQRIVDGESLRHICKDESIKVESL
ncbi:terminase small subunit-like protein [Commensalibacter communis]